MFGNMPWRRSRKSPWTAGCCCLRPGTTCTVPIHQGPDLPPAPPFPPLPSLSSHPLQYFYKCPTNLLSLTLRSFPEGLSGRSVAYQTHFPFQNSLKPLPWACWVQRPCFITSCPSLSPLPLQGLEIIIWAWPSPGPSLGYHITWFENINQTNLASLSRFRTENPTQKTESVSCLNRAEGGCEKSERSVINKVNPWA